MPHIVDPGPWIRQRVAEETAPLRAQLAEATTGKERRRLRWQIWQTSMRIRHQFRGGGPVKF